jgi:hypothetical protein
MVAHIVVNSPCLPACLLVHPKVGLGCAPHAGLVELQLWLAHTVLASALLLLLPALTAPPAGLDAGGRGNPLLAEVQSSTHLGTTCLL